MLPRNHPDRIQIAISRLKGVGVGASILDDSATMGDLQVREQS